MPDDLAMFAYLYLEPDKGPPIDGESQDWVHEDEIQVVRYSYGVSNQDVGKTGGEKSQSEPQDVVMSTLYSIASPQLFIMAARGDKIKRATISIRKLGPQDRNDADYMQIQLCEVYIKDYKVTAGDGPRPTEEFTLKYQTLDVAYRQQNDDGMLKKPVCRAYTWNLHKDMPTNLPFYPWGSS